jgi:hypothetical protein
MKPLYESILKSTGSGKTYFPLWSKWFYDDQWVSAAKEFCNFYDIHGKALRSQIKELFLSFVQKSDPVIERFRFVADYDIDKKLKENTRLSDEEIKSMRSFKINLMDVYLIIESDEKFWVWKQGSQLFDRLLFDVSKYLARE